MKYLAFDLGGSGGKLFLADHEGASLQLQEIHRFAHHPIQLSGHLYWNIFQIIEELNQGVRKAISLTDDSIDSIGFDSFCNDFTLVSPRGEILAPVRCYRDPRTLEHRDAFFRVMSDEELYNINGNQNAPFNTLPHLHAMKLDEDGYLLQQNARLIFVSDLFIYLLTGEMVCEYTTASVTQMYDYRTHDWSDTVLQAYGIERKLFPKVLDPGICVGKTTDDYNRAMNTKGFQVATVCQHDTASAFLAALPITERAIISCGTWSIVGTESDAPVISDYGYRHNIANEGSAPGHHRLLINVMGTWIIQEMRYELEQQGISYSYGDIEKLALAAGTPECPVNVDDPDFYEPGHMIEKVQAAIQRDYDMMPGSYGMLFYSVYAGLACKYRQAIEQLEEITGKPLQVIQMLGGGCQSALMCQMTANVCNRTVIAGPVEATALGNVIMQMHAANEISSVTEGRDLIKKNTTYTEYHPQDTLFWETQYQRFRKQKGD